MGNSSFDEKRYSATTVEADIFEKMACPAVGVDNSLGSLMRGGAGKPQLFDMFSEPRSPLAQVFQWCGWATVAVDLLRYSKDDVSQPNRLNQLGTRIQRAVFVSVAFDCSTKSRICEMVSEVVLPNWRSMP